MAFFTTVNAQASHTPPATWNVIQSISFSSGQLFSSWAYKICTGTEDIVTWAYPTAGAATLVITEWNDAVTTLDSSSEDESDITTATTTFDTGSATASVASGLAIAFFGADSGRNVDAGRAYNNSFVEDIASFAAAADRGACFIASKAISGAGGYACQYTCTDTGDRGYGSIALFVTPATGGQPYIKRAGGVPGMRLNRGVW